jgi:hypothetical protein
VIGSEFYRGQGFGNQLWVYATIKSAAKRNGLEYGFIGHDEFKGKQFMDLDLGVEVDWKKSDLPSERVPSGFQAYKHEIQTFHPTHKWDLSGFSKEFYDLPDGVFIDGCFQAEGYIEEYQEEFQNMMRVESQFFDGCTIHFRAGDYVKIKDVFLPPSYYLNAIEKMRNLVPGVKFKIVTDGPKIAAKLFPGIAIESSGSVKVLANRWYFQQDSKRIGVDFGKIQNSRYLILSNSSFSWWGAWTNPQAEAIIGPKYWTRFNTSDGYWGLKDSLTKNWLWLDRSGNLSGYDECLAELIEYRKSHSWA